MTNFDNSWGLAVIKGTLLEQPTLYEDDVNTPENLQRCTQFYCPQHSTTNSVHYISEQSLLNTVHPSSVYFCVFV